MKKNKKSLVLTTIMVGLFIFMYAIPLSLSREVYFLEDSKVIVKERINFSLTAGFLPCIESTSLKIKVLESEGTKEKYCFTVRGNKVYGGGPYELYNFFKEYDSRDEIHSKFLGDFFDYLSQKDKQEKIILTPSIVPVAIFLEPFIGEIIEEDESQ